MRGHRVVKIDSSQPAIVAALEAEGWTVFSTAGCGNGAPDLVCGADGLNVLFEVKNPGPPSAQALTDKEAKFHQRWYGQVAIVWTPEQAVRIVRECLAARPVAEIHCPAWIKSVLSNAEAPVTEPKPKLLPTPGLSPRLNVDSAIKAQLDKLAPGDHTKAVVITGEVVDGKARARLALVLKNELGEWDMETKAYGEVEEGFEPTVGIQVVLTK